MTQTYSHPPITEAADRLTSLKAATAEAAVQLDSVWRSGLFRQLDELLDDETWDAADTLPTLASYRTFLRVIAALGHPSRPSLGCGDNGDIIASWVRDGDQLTIECHDGGQLKWALARVVSRETQVAAGTCDVATLPPRLVRYEPWC